MRVAALLFAAAVAGSLLVVSPPAHAAAPAVQITRIWYDSPGVDRRSNASLNAEYVRIRNTTTKNIKLEGWILRDKTGYRYAFGPVVLRAGKQLVIRTGQGSDTSTTVYWGRGAYVWNNDTDTAYLRRADGRLVDSCSYNSTRYDYTTCT